MTQNEKWKIQYDRVMDYIQENHRRPSKHRHEDRFMVNWLKYNRRMMSHGKMSEERLKLFRVLLAEGAKYHRTNQYDTREL